MFVPDKLKLNKFKEVSIPENRDYFARYGFLRVPENAYSGEEVVPLSGTKIDDIEAGLEYDRLMQEKELEKNE